MANLYIYNNWCSFLYYVDECVITYKKELLCGQGGVMSSPVIVCLPYVHKGQLFTVTTLSIADKKSNPTFSAFQKFNSYTKTCYHQELLDMFTFCF